jgi:hypothetical protein
VNPVVQLPTDNNGVSIRMSSVGSAGAVSTTGSLVFGIDTQSNNQLGTATVLKVDGATGNFTTMFAGQTLANSFIDAGSNALFFPSSLPTCTSAAATGFYCPGTVQTLSATQQGVNGMANTVTFSIANAEALQRNSAFAVFDNLGGTNPQTGSFDWGLPFFLGRTVFVAVEGQTTSSGTGPFIAY